MTMLLILGAGIAAFAIFIAGCFVGHRTGRNEGSDSANRWEATYESWMERQPTPPDENGYCEGERIGKMNSSRGGGE